MAKMMMFLGITDSKFVFVRSNKLFKVSHDHYTRFVAERNRGMKLVVENQVD